MLVLTRKRDQRILIGENIEIVVISIDRDRVKLGVVAPAEIIVDREEVRKARQREATLLQRQQQQHQGEKP